MTKRTHSLLLLLLLVLLSSCDLFSPSQEGRLMIRFPEVSRSIRFEPGTSLDTAYYVLTLKKGDRIITKTQEKHGGSILIDALTPGTWIIFIDAYNEDDKRIGWLDKNQQGERSLSVEILRGQTASADARITSYTEGSGTLSITIDWTQVHPDLINDVPLVTLQLESINNGIDGYESHSGEEDITLSLGEHSETLTLTDGILDEITFTGDGTAQLITLEGLPAGWYKISVSIYDDGKFEKVLSFLVTTDPGQQRTDRLWKGVCFARIEKDVTTEGTITLLDERLELGSGGIVITDEMESPFEVEIVPHGDNEGGAGKPMRFSSSIAGEGLLYRWYVNGERVAEAGGNELEYSFDTEGVFSLALSVRDNGVWVGASLEVTVDPYLVGDTGPAGGIIFFDKGRYDNTVVRRDELSGEFVTVEGVFSSFNWRYLEAAPQGWTEESQAFFVTTYDYQDNTSDPPSLWGGVSTEPLGAEASGFGAGAGNTAVIVSSGGQHNSAALRASDASIGGFGDWFLPSIDELSEMFQVLHREGLGEFDDAYYWSSTEFDGAHGWAKSFIDGFHIITVGDAEYNRFAFAKNSVRLIRPVRAF